MKIKYREIRLSKANKERLDKINEIIEGYQGQDLTLTLRQLYYQLVTRNIIANKQTEYHKLGKLLKEGRMAGIVDWEAIADRTRDVEIKAGWVTASSILQSASYAYGYPLQMGQEMHIEVWCEKDAISEIVERICNVYHIPVMVNRGYSSVSAMHDSYTRFKDKQNVVILYLGDHDPSGLQMIEDINKRILEFRDNEYQEGSFEFEIVPIALTMAQIKKYNPPVNPAKMSDPRAGDYVKIHGKKSWEVDALSPEVLNDLIKKEIEKRLDMDVFEEMKERETEEQNKLDAFIETYSKFKPKK